MSVLADLKTEIENYPRDFLDLELVDISPAVGTSINRGEEVRFQVQITNRGTLDVHGLSLVIRGLNGTLVKTGNAQAQFVTSLVTSVGFIDTVPAHQPENPVTTNGTPFAFKATSSSAVARDLVRVEVGEWDTDLNHVLIAHSDPDTAAQGTFSAVVSPQ